MLEREAKQLVVEIFKLKEQADSIVSLISAKRLQLQEYFDKEQELIPRNAKVQPLIIDGRQKRLSATLVRRVSVDFDPVKLQKTLQPEVFNQVVAKTYTIKNISEFIKLLKNYGIPPHKFKELIDIRLTANPYLIKKFFEQGEILPGELEGTYQSKITKHVSITVKEKEQGNG